VRAKPTTVAGCVISHGSLRSRSYCSAPEKPDRHDRRTVDRVESSGPGDDYSEQIAQAQGMVSVQVDCPLDEALLLMRARAVE
jgi:hypothetical protein